VAVIYLSDVTSNEESHQGDTCQMESHSEETVKMVNRSPDEYIPLIHS
jgi:hypothetical protein